MKGMDTRFPNAVLTCVAVTDMFIISRPHPFLSTRDTASKFPELVRSAHAQARARHHGGPY
jgi:hypothetical protein